MVCHSGPKLTTLVLKNVQDQSGIATVVRLPLWSSLLSAMERKNVSTVMMSPAAQVSCQASFPPRNLICLVTLDDMLFLYSSTV